MGGGGGVFLRWLAELPKVLLLPRQLLVSEEM